MDWIEKIKAAFPGSSKERIGPETITIDIPSTVYVKELAIYSAVSLIANAISQSEIKVYKNYVCVKDEDYFSLNIKPNPNESASHFWHKVIEKALRDERGALCFISGRNLYCADSFVLEQRRPFVGNLYSGVVIDDFQMDRKFTSDQVFIFKLENIQAKKLIDGLYADIGSIISTAMSAYKDTNAVKYKFKIDSVQAGDEAFNKEFENILKEPLKKFIDGDAKLYVEYNGRTLEKMKSDGTSKSSDDTISLIEEMFKIVGKAFKIPESLMLGNITNMNDVVKSFLTFSVDPWADMIGQVLTGQYGYANWKNGNYFRVDTSTVNHVDIFDMADKIDKLISSAFASIDEVREKAGLDILNEDWSKNHLLTKNYEFINEKNKMIGGKDNETTDDDEI